MGTWATNGSMLAQSTMVPGLGCAGRSGREAAGAAPAGWTESTATTSQVPLTLASSISLARISRPPTKLIR